MDLLSANRAFDAEATRLLGSTFDAAWEKVQTSDGLPTDQEQVCLVRESLAKFIIAMVEQGERNPNRLIEKASLHCDMPLEHARLPKTTWGEDMPSERSAPTALRSAGFGATASYFEDRARRARDPHSQASLREVAGFYRRLAGIAPGFPPGFTCNKVHSRGDRWQQRAEECRTMAEHFTDLTAREQMRRLADTYDSMAAMAE